MITLCSQMHRDPRFGYNKAYKVIKCPLVGSLVDLVSQFYLCSRAEFHPWNERKTVPALKIWKDKLADWWDKSSKDTFHKTYAEDTIQGDRRKQRRDRLRRLNTGITTVEFRVCRLSTCDDLMQRFSADKNPALL